MDAPAVAVSADGKRVAVAWMDERARGNRDVWWRVATSGKFAEERPLHDEAANLQAHPALAIDEAGIVHAAWEDGRSGPTKIYYASSAGGKNQAVSGEGRAAFPSLVCTKSSVVIAWETGDEKVMARALPR